MIQRAQQGDTYKFVWLLLLAISLTTGPRLIRLLLCKSTVPTLSHYSIYSYSYWELINRIFVRVVMILAVLVTVYSFYQFLRDQINEILDEIKKTWRDRLWSELKKHWREVLRIGKEFAREFIGPALLLALQYFKKEIKPAVKVFGRFVVTKCKALAAYIYRKFEKIHQHVQSGALRRKIKEAFHKAVIKFKEVGMAMGQFLRVHVPIAVRNLLHDFNNGFFPIMEALFLDLGRGSRRVLEMFANLNAKIARGIFNDIKDKLQRAKESMKASLKNLGNSIKHKMKMAAKQLGRQALAAIKKRILQPLWNWVKSDWRKLTGLISDYVAPRWKTFISKLLRFLRNEIDENPRIRERVDAIINGVKVHIVAMVFLIISAYFYEPTGDIRALSPSFSSECHQLGPEASIQKVLAPAIPDHQWHDICTNLGVDAKLLSVMQLSYTDDSDKMETCLKAFVNQESPCWETVVLAVCGSPFYDEQLAKNITDEYDITWTPLEHLCSAKVK